MKPITAAGLLFLTMTLLLISCSLLENDKPIQEDDKPIPEEDKPFQVELEKVLALPSIVPEESISSFTSDGTKLFHFYRSPNGNEHIRKIDLSTKAVVSDVQIAYTRYDDKTILMADELVANTRYGWDYLPGVSGGIWTLYADLIDVTTGKSRGQLKRRSYNGDQLSVSSDGSKLLWTWVGYGNTESSIEVIHLGGGVGSADPYTFSPLYSFKATTELEGLVSMSKFLTDSLVVSAGARKTFIHRINTKTVTELPELNGKKVLLVEVINTPAILLFATKDAFYFFNKNTFSYQGEVRLPEWVGTAPAWNPEGGPKISKVSVHPVLPLALVQLVNSDKKLYLDLSNKVIGLDTSGFSTSPTFSSTGEFLLTQGVDSTFVWRVKNITF